MKSKTEGIRAYLTFLAYKNGTMLVSRNLLSGVCRLPSDMGKVLKICSLLYKKNEVK